MGRVASQRFGLSLMLPDPKGWAIVRERSSFLVLDHAASASRLVVRLWHEDERMVGERCEERARLLRPLPQTTDALERGRVAAPPGFDTTFAVGVDVDGAGYVAAFGAHDRRCFAFAFTTTAGDPSAPDTIASRLAVIRSRTLPETELRAAIGKAPHAP